MDLVYHDYVYDFDGTLQVGACDCRGSGGWLKLSYDKIASLEDVARGLHKLWALHTWRRERRYGVEYDITAPWPCYETTYYSHDGEKVAVRGRSLGDFQGIVHEVCTSPKHVRVLLLKEEGGGQGGRGEDELGRLSLADHDSYMGMATWLHRLWGRHTGNEVAPGTWISRVAESWPGYHVRMMSRDDEEEMDEATFDFEDCILKLEGISIIRQEDK